MKKSASKASRLAAGLSKWKIPPASSWRPKSRGAYLSSGLFWPLCVLAISLGLLFISAFISYFYHSHSDILRLLELSLISSAAIAAFLIVSRTQQQLIDPLTHLRFWAMRMRGGNLAARLPEESKGEFRELAKDINDLSESLHDLTRDMKEQVRIQTERSANKSRSLKLLYDVATSINNSRNFDELLQQFLKVMKNLVHAQAATIRLLTDDDELRLVAHSGLSEATIDKEYLVSIHRCQCGTALKENSLLCQDVVHCKTIIEQSLFKNDKLKMIAVPLKYRGKTLGIYNLFVDKNDASENEELRSLLTSIGQHMGVAIAKAKLEEDARRLALMEERTFLSHELHDSLAQTLSSLKIRMRILNDTLKDGNADSSAKELHTLDQGLQKANSDLRELLDTFRAPMDERGLIPALTQLTQQLQLDSGITVFFQNESNSMTLLPAQEIQVLHIVQEAISNIRKHSQAKHVRLLVRASREGHWQVIIEDDGIGFKHTNRLGKPGEHIGLSIMRERAEHIGGKLELESEPGEGTRLQLTFNQSKDFSTHPYPVTKLHPEQVVEEAV